MRNAFDSYALGATLYMPIVHPKVEDFLFGRAPAPASSLVLCLEDALAEYDVQRGLEKVRALCHGSAFACDAQVYLRPRSRDMARTLAHFRGIGKFAGFVAPKVTPDTVGFWLDIARGAGLRLMPTLESAAYFDPAAVSAVRDQMLSHDRGQIAAVRLGGNDLLGALALRRTCGMTSWEGPLGWVLSMMSSMLISAGFPVAAPVFDIIDDLDTLRREVERDVASGFVSKTAIHPAQVGIIEDAFRVSPQDLEQARAILDSRAHAVFQIGGAMCEPSTHRAWAERTVARAEVFGAAAPAVPMRKVSI
ncbi:HpcH/HpaI aldolase/citrate lyase family protein [Salipiger marinus]|uniref:Citrate lyase beta subunit n=1 Tax=Salipiger marinus TaxID=555512 RepID=A0A1G8UJ94_9RHOB|nr:HpcH/HpaI aldolase/citrate lyase family protein [Salipiger marinus]SDJ53946.1 Citrate lyase beta subunit [Salipiger marinus]